jgi:hypothetical protein
LIGENKIRGIKRERSMFCWGKKHVNSWLDVAKVRTAKISSKQGASKKGCSFLGSQNNDLGGKNGVHLVLGMIISARMLVRNARAALKPHCCLHSQNVRTQAEPTDIAHNMSGQIKMKVP